MRPRLRNILAALAVWAGGLTEELLCAFALLLIAGGFWLMPSWRAAALLVPGAVILWLALPARTPFIERSLTVPKRKAN